MKKYKDLSEKTLTPAEKKKREEIAKAMERENPGMDMKKKMAIATWQAKKVAEQADSSMCCKHCGDEFGKPTNEKCMYDAYDPKGKNWVKKESYNEAKVDEISLATLSTNIAKSTGTKNIKTAMKPGEVKKGLDDLKKRLGTLGQSMQKEAKDPAEYDREGEMVKSQLKTMIDAAQELHDQLGDDDNLPEWVQGKITKATDYIDSVRDYMKSEVNEELDEFVVNSRKSTPSLRRKSLANKPPKMQGDFLKKERERNRAHDDAMGRTPTGRKKPVRQMTSTQRSLAKMRNEEKVDEISTPTLMRYRDKARQSANKAKNSAMASAVRGDKDGYKRDTATMNKREKGLKNADRAAVRNTRRS